MPYRFDPILFLDTTNYQADMYLFNGGGLTGPAVQSPGIFKKNWQNWTAKWTGGPFFVVHVYNNMWSSFKRFWSSFM